MYTYDHMELYMYGPTWNELASVRSPAARAAVYICMGGRWACRCGAAVSCCRSARALWVEVRLGLLVMTEWD